MKPLMIFLSLLLVFAFQACEQSDDVNLLNNSPIVSFNPDASGNLKIINLTGDSLILYVNQVLLRGILPGVPGNGFIVNIPATGQVQTLKLFRLSDVAAPDRIPSDDRLVKRWDIVLPSNTSEQLTWLVQSETQASGIVLFNYPEMGLNQIPAFYSVDVFLNSKTGTRIQSLNPGTMNRQLSLPYGSYRLFFSYWYSDPNGLEPPVHAGWIETGENGQEYYAILNATHKELNFEVPVNYFGSTGKKGTLVLTNHFDEPLRIMANNVLIENFVVSGQSVSGLSTINASETVNYCLKAGEYNLTFLSMEGAVVGEKRFCMINELYEYDLAISPGQTFRLMTIVNQTPFRLSIHKELPENYLGSFPDSGTSCKDCHQKELKPDHYLGLYIDPGTVKIMEYPASAPRLKAINWLDYHVFFTTGTEVPEWIITY